MCGAAGEIKNKAVSLNWVLAGAVAKLGNNERNSGQYTIAVLSLVLK